MDLESREGVARALGVNDIRAAGRARNYAYAYPFNFSAVANGSASAITQKITAAAAFVVVAVCGIIHDGSGSARDGDLATVEFSANEGQWQQAALPWDCAVGTVTQPFYYTGLRPVCAPGANVVVRVTNNTGGAATGAVVLHGYHLGI